MRVVESAVVEKGLELDRRLMLIDSQNQFMTQRTRPKMCLFDVRLNGHHFIVKDKSGKFTEPIQIDLCGQLHAKNIKATIWDDEVEVREVDSKISSWFSELLNEPCRLVQFPEENKRPIETNLFSDEKNVSLADGSPLLIISRESLDLLNSKMNFSMSMKRFRPNLVISGGGAHEEDRLGRFRIGKHNFATVKPCPRCVLTTVNPDTGEIGEEPLKTLAGYRKQETKINFGMDVIPIDYGIIKEGDEIILQ